MMCIWWVSHENYSLRVCEKYCDAISSWNHTSARRKVYCHVFVFLEEKLYDWKASTQCGVLIISGLQIIDKQMIQFYKHVHMMISQVIVSREALLLDRQFIYKEQTHTHTTKNVMMANFQRVIGNLYPTDLDNQSIVSLILYICYWIRASNEKYLETYNHQQSSPFYFIKISPWWATDSQILTVDRKRYLQ